MVLDLEGQGLEIDVEVLGFGILGLKIHSSGFVVQGFGGQALSDRVYWGTSLIRPPPPVGPYSSPMPRDLR